MIKKHLGQPRHVDWKGSADAILDIKDIIRCNEGEVPPEPRHLAVVGDDLPVSAAGLCLQRIAPDGETRLQKVGSLRSAFLASPLVHGWVGKTTASAQHIYIEKQVSQVIADRYDPSILFATARTVH